MIHTADVLFNWALWGAFTWYVISLVLHLRHRIPPRWYYGGDVIADAVILLHYILRTLDNGPHALTWATGFWAGALAYDWWQWRKHRDDDDDWGKRLKSWAKSHIPKPTVLRLRAGVGAA